MKHIIFSFCLFIGVISDGNKSSKNADYIEVKHVGAEEAIIRPLFISDKSVTIQLNGDRVRINNQKSMFSNDREQWILSRNFYEILLTDSIIFKNMKFFITQHQSLRIQAFEWPKQRDVDYLIILNGKRYKISYKIERDFFSQMIKFLKTEKCNSHSVAALNSSLKYVSNVPLH